MINTYSKLGVITTGLLSIGTIVYFYYYGGNPPMVKETQLSEPNDSDTEN
jgi:hypothetical protein